MDDRRFDEISKHLSTGLSRKGILRLLGGLGAAGVSAAGVLLPSDAKKKRGRKKQDNDRDKGNDRDNHKRDNDKNSEAAQPAQAEAKKAKGKGKGKGKGKKRGKNKKQQQGSNQSPPQDQVNVQAAGCGIGKALICHAAGGSGNYTVNCVDDGAVCEGGHAGHDGDCICQTSGVLCPGEGGFLPSCEIGENVACGLKNGSATCAGCVTGTTACGPNCCPSNQTCCEVVGTSICVDTSSLCGGQCGNICGPNQTCCNGTCVATNTLCGGICGNVCGPNQTCCGDTCVATSGLCGGICGNVCDANETCCVDECIATASFCGATCNVCEAGEKCCSGTYIPVNNCCIDDDCPPELRQVADCSNGRCDYTPVADNVQGPLCTGQGQFCCGGDTCCITPEVCTSEGTCCTPATCAAYPDQCGTFTNNCGGQIECSCGNDTCCNGICVSGDECCATDQCDAVICQTVVCADGTCDYTPVSDNEQGTLCTDLGEFCCNSECCEVGQICAGEEGCCTPKTCGVDYAGQCGTFAQGCGLPDLTCECRADETCNPQAICVTIVNCIPVPIEQACAGLQCGPVSNGCGVDYECGPRCPTKKTKGQRPQKQTCVSGVCKPFKKKRCIGSGLAGQPCSGKCKCANGRNCDGGRCCEGRGDGSVHCNANNDCCPGLMCAYRRPGQHRVCMPRNAKSLFTESTASTATPGIAAGAVLTGLVAKLGTRLTGNSEPASVAMDELQIHAMSPRDQDI